MDRDIYKEAMLIIAPIQKFEKMWNNLMHGRAVYRTIDGRIIDFNRGLELSQSGFILRKIYCSFT
jgi:hypothetical protein